MATAADEEPPLNFGVIKTLTGHIRAINSMKFSPNGRRLLSASEDGAIKIWNLNAGNLLKCFPSDQQAVNDVDWSPDGSLVVSASDDNLVKLWDVERGKVFATLRGHTNFVAGCKFNPQGTLLATTSYDETMRVWDLRSGNTIVTTPPQGCPIGCVIFNRDGSKVINGNFDGFCEIWEMAAAKLLLKLESSSATVASIKLLPDENWLFTVASDDLVKVWNTNDRALKVYSGHTNSFYFLKGDYYVDPTKQTHLVCGSEDNSVYIWNYESQAIEQKLDGHNSVVVCAACHPFREVIATTAFLCIGSYHPIKIWQNNVF